MAMHNGALDKKVLERFMALDITATKKVLFLTLHKSQVLKRIHYYF